MRAYGSDRVRVAGGKVILHSRLPKGWTPRRAKEGTHAEFPGTAVLWEEELFEVVAAEAMPSGGVRYVLEAWNDAQTIRVSQSYSEESEAALAADHERARTQRRTSVAARLAGVALGNLPGSVQQRLANELGLSPVAMTLLSLVPSVVLLGTCLFIGAGAAIEQRSSPVPLWLWLIAFFWFFESLVRFVVVLTQSRGVGSLAGCAYHVLTHPRASIKESRDLLTTPNVVTPAELEMRDRLTMRGPLLTLLTVDEQRRLAERHAFDYRQHAHAITWTILAGALLGVVSSIATLLSTFRLSALLSLLVAVVLLVEQLVRLPALRRGPAASVLAFVVRPFVRDLL
ncbi:MAG TPA: hypothetical protein VFO89_07295 [Thermoanaerobaculia bacterium]|nr:hypothetical protein [Thermoanaerobaculia bacterium]